VRIFGSMALRYAGRYAKLRRFYDEHVPEAERRGDRYTEATLTRVANIIWLAADVPDVATEDLKRRAWRPPAGAYHMQNWYEWRALAEIALYQRRTAALLAEAVPTQQALRRSMLARVQTVRAEAFWLDGRLALAEAEVQAGERAALASRALRMARKLAGEKMGYASVWARLLRAGATYQLGDPAGAIVILREAVAAADAAHLESCAAAAELMLGRILGGDTGAVHIDRAHPRLTQEGVRDAPRFAHVLVPGFEPG
jgi:hypothetical protein